MSAITLRENYQDPHGHGPAQAENQACLRTSTVILKLTSHWNPLVLRTLQSEPLEVGEHLRFPSGSLRSQDWEPQLSGQIGH